MALLNMSSEPRSLNILKNSGEETGVNIEMTHSVMTPIGSLSVDAGGAAESSNVGTNGDGKAEQQPELSPKVAPTGGVRSQNEVQVEMAATTVDVNNNENLETMCRICRDDSGEMETMRACMCKGSMGLFHPTCLEKWLLQSGRRACEICTFGYSITSERRYKGFTMLREWFKTTTCLLDIGMWINALIPLISVFGVCVLWITTFRAKGYPNGELYTYIIAGSVILLTVLVVISIACAFVWCGWISVGEFRSWLNWKAKTNVILKVLPITVSEIEAQAWNRDHARADVILLQPEPTIRDHGIGIQV